MPVRGNTGNLSQPVPDFPALLFFLSLSPCSLTGSVPVHPFLFRTTHPESFRASGLQATSLVPLICHPICRVFTLSPMPPSVSDAFCHAMLANSLYGQGTHGRASNLGSDLDGWLGGGGAGRKLTHIPYTDSFSYAWPIQTKNNNNCASYPVCLNMGLPKALSPSPSG